MMSFGPAAAQPQPGNAPAGSISLMSAVVPSSDLDRSTRFYTEGLGLSANKGANPREVVLEFPGGGSRLMLLKPAEGSPAARRGPSRIIIQVADLKATSARLQRAGYALDGDIRANPQYRIAIAEVSDPDGNSIELIERGR